MASPVVQEAVESATPTTAATAHTVTLPTATAGQLLIIIGDKGSTSATVTDTDGVGLTELLDENLANGLYIAYRQMTGSEPASCTLTTSSSTRFPTIAYRISGAANPATRTPEIGTTGTGTSATPDPPAAVMTGGSKDYLVIAFAGMAGEEADDDTWGNTPPTNYTPSPPRQKTCGTVGTSLGGLVLSAERALTASSENPGTFGVDTSAAWRSQTITVHPDLNVTITVDTAGAFTLTGQSTGLGTTITPSAGAVTWAGATDITLSVISGTALEYGWDEVGRFWTSASSETGVYPAATDTLSESGVWLTSLQPAGGATTITVTVPGALTWTGQQTPLTNTVTPTAGAITWTGQQVPLRNTVSVTTPGAITWAGQSVGLRTTITPTQGALTWTGQAVPTKSTLVVSTVGAITWTGSSGITLIVATVVSVTTQGQLTWTGQSVASKLTDSIVAGAITWTGGTVTATQSVTVTTAGALTWTGQATGQRNTITPSAGAITWTGQTAGLQTTLTISQGAVTWSGQSVGLKNVITPTTGAITWSGATDITLVVTGSIISNVTVPGAITWTGQSVGLVTTVTPTSGAVTWQGQAVGLKTSINTAAGAVTWTGSALGLKTSINAVAGNITWNGSTVTLVAGGNVTITVDVPGAITWTGQQLGLKTFVNTNAGAVVWAGQSLGLRTSLGVAAGNVIWAGATDIALVGSIPNGIPVCDPQAVLTGIEAEAVLVGVDGEAVLVGVGAKAETVGTNGKVSLVGTEGKAAIVCT